MSLDCCGRPQQRGKTKSGVSWRIIIVITPTGGLVCSNLKDTTNVEHVCIQCFSPYLCEIWRGLLAGFIHRNLNWKSSSGEHLFPHQQTRRTHIGKVCKVWPPSSWHLNTFSPGVPLYKPPLLTKIGWSFSCSLCSASSSFDAGSISQKPLSGKQSGTRSSFFALITHWVSSAGSFSRPANELEFGIILTKKLKIIRLLSWVWF